MAEGLIEERLASAPGAFWVEVSCLRIVYNCRHDCLEAGTLIRVKLSLYYRRIGYLAVIIDLLVYCLIAYSLVKDVLRQASIY